MLYKGISYLRGKLILNKSKVVQQNSIFNYLLFINQN